MLIEPIPQIALILTVAKMMKVFGLLILLSLSNCFECDKEGYEKYLDNYKLKTNETDTYIDRLDRYTSRCNSLANEKKTCGYADFTSLMDWSDEELDELGRLGVEYSGNPILFTESVTITQDEMSIEMKSREFDDLDEYNDPKKKCSTSWATAAVRAAEAALNYRVELSEEQLFKCLPKDLGFADGCEGIHPKKLMEYLLEEGLVEKNAFTNCDELDNLERYRFETTTADPPTAGGLMNMLAKESKPVFVMMAINLKKLMFVKDMTNIKDVVKCGGYQPSLYGVLTGYKYYENTESSNSGKTGWWEVVTNVIPVEEIVMKIPMSSNMENGNYAGIAAYAFTLSEVIELPCGEDLVVSDNTECVKLLETGWRTITVNEGLCNDMKVDYEISNYKCLESIEVKKNSLQYLSSFKVTNNKKLTTIVLEAGTCSNYYSRRGTGVFFYVPNVVIESLISMIC